ncbi:hypothetical protein ACGFX7_26965 [Streptomyces harbinensis]|uniref:hypothetical protein n=1 Tax=Streptomyces harbinensis TaxID=1176198 RepID=UPI00371F199A
MPTHYTPTEKALRRLERLRRETLAVAVALVVEHGQELGKTARASGITHHQLRQAVLEAEGR